MGAFFCFPSCCASPFFSFLGGSCVARLVFGGLALGTSLTRLVAACWFEAASSDMRHFISPCVVCLSLFWVVWIMSCLPGFVAPWMLSHISNMLMFPGFSRHVHVGHVYGFSLEFLDVLLSGLSWSTFRHSIGIESSTGAVVPNPLYARSQCLVGFFVWSVLSCVRFHA